MKKAKILHIEEEVIRAIDIEGAERIPKSDFKNICQNLIEDHGHDLIALKKQNNHGTKN